jgi:hypothetical protein
MFLTNPRKKNPDESNLENEEAREWVPSSYPTIRKLPAQKSTNTTGEVGWCTIQLENSSFFSGQRVSCSINRMRGDTFPGPFVLQT